MSEWFVFRTAADLLAKLERDFVKLRTNPLDADLAFNYFLTAEHLLDWQFPGQTGKEKRTEARRNEVMLQVTSHLASGMKHLRVEAKHHQAVRATGRSSGLFPAGYWPPGYFPPGFHGEHLYVQLDGEAARLLGKQVGVVVLAEKVLALWRERLAR